MDDYMNDITKFVENAIEKAKELGGTAKTHALIKAEEAKKQEQYFRLGRRYYKLFKDTPEQDLLVFVDKLKACDARIEELKESLPANDGADFTEVEPKDEAGDASEADTERSE